MNESKPRKQRVDLDGIVNPEQREVARLISDIIKEKKTTQAEFAKEIGVSLPTISNIYRPTFGRAPSVKVLLAIAQATATPALTYEKLIKASGYSIEQYPYSEGNKSFAQKMQENHSAMEAQLKLSMLLTNMKERAFIKPVDASSYFHFNLSADFEEGIFRRWNFRFKFGVTEEASLLERFMYLIMKDGAKEDNKYSIVVDNTEAYNTIKDFNFKKICANISVILYDGNGFKECILSTECNSEIIERDTINLE